MSNLRTTPESLSAPPPAFDLGRLQQFMPRVLGDFSAATTMLACAVGDRVGLFEELRSAGPSTADQLAGRSGIDVRWLRQWLATLAAAGYLEYQPEGGLFSIPPEHHALLADQGGGMTLAGGLELLLGFAGAAHEIVRSIRAGRGVPQSAYEPHVQAGMDRMSAPWFETLLVQQWLPAVPGLPERLRAGMRVADVGGGSGRALIALAKAFPRSTFWGYDVFPPALARAQANLAAAGLAGRVEVAELGVAGGMPGRFDLITSFNSLHDFRDQTAGLKAIRESLMREGLYLILESACSDKLEENLNPLGAMLYGTSFLYSTPVSLANGGCGAGAILAETGLLELCRAAGLRARRLPTTNPMHALYEARPWEATK